jgi:hypothetical protein
MFCKDDILNRKPIKKMFVDPAPANRTFNATDIETGEVLRFPEKNLKDFTALFDVVKPDGTPLLSPPVEEKLWDFFESLVRISICYVHIKRCPDPVTKKYTQNFFPSMKVKSQVELWQITKLE